MEPTRPPAFNLSDSGKSLNLFKTLRSIRSLVIDWKSSPITTKSGMWLINTLNSLWLTALCNPPIFWTWKLVQLALTPDRGRRTTGQCQRPVVQCEQITSPPWQVRAWLPSASRPSSCSRWQHKGLHQVHPPKPPSLQSGGLRPTYPRDRP